MGTFKIKNYSISSKQCTIDLDEFCHRLEETISKHGVDKEFTPFINNVRENNQGNLFNCHSNEDFFLSEELENSFFKCLLGEISVGTCLTKYTTIDSLLRLCKDNETAMVSIVGMNDSTECFYASDYLNKKGTKTYLTKPDNYFYGKKTFITSFTRHSDDLTMWRLYGDAAKGIVMTFEVDADVSNGFIIAPVSYGESNETHKELDLIAELLTLELNGRKFDFHNLYIWRHFFKPVQYKTEGEVRLLYFQHDDKKQEWVKTGVGVIAPIAKFTIEDKSKHFEKNKNILYPLKLKEITLGPEMKDVDTNKELIALMLNDSFGWRKEDVIIKESIINNYRTT